VRDNQGYGTDVGTEYTYQEEVPPDIREFQENPWPSQPLPVISATQEEAPEYGSTMTYSIPQFGVGTPLQILTRRIRRHKAYVEVTFTVPGSVTFNSRQDPLSSNNGYIVSVPVAGLYRFPDWESQQPLFCIASVSGLVVAVIDMSYAER
jgi:hypothetical protein